MTLVTLLIHVTLEMLVPLTENATRLIEDYIYSDSYSLDSITIWLAFLHQ
jgi:hypothetical protein